MRKWQNWDCQNSEIPESIDIKFDMDDYVGDVTPQVICGLNTISMLWGNTAFCVKSSGEDLSLYSNNIESFGLRQCPHYHYLTKKVISQ